MTEDQETKKEKPKTALIKHKKTPAEISENESKNDHALDKESRKKIVVVKKKVVVVKKTDKSASVPVQEIKQETEVSRSEKVTDKAKKTDKEDKAEKIEKTAVMQPENKESRPQTRPPEEGLKKERSADAEKQKITEPARQERPAYNRPTRFSYRNDSQQRPAGTGQSSGRSPASTGQGQPGNNYQQDRPQHYRRDGQSPGNTGQGPGNTGQGPGSTGQGYRGTGRGPGSTGQGYRGTGQGPGSTGQGYRGTGQGPSVGYTPGGGGGFRGRPQNDSNRSGYQPQSGGRSFDKSSPPRFTGGQNRFTKPSGPSAGKDDIKADSAVSKTAGKKFFKAKKKSVYQKNKKDQDVEKNFNVKKKTIQKINPVPKEIDIMEVITVAELARKMNLKASDVISRFMAMGMMVTINQQIDAETAEIVASEYDCKVNIVSLYDQTIVECDKGDDVDIIERPPIVTVMGHVDHGKTKLLDAIRSTDIVASEHGGITQHIGAYKVTVRNNRSIVFLDTPGHEAFTLMRARGAHITDIVVLVVAANDGVMPQTIEAINHAKDAKVPIIVAVNKIDIPEANPDRVKQQLSAYDLIPEDWGGNTIFCEISALKKTGIDNLLENILIQSEILELKANPNCRAEGKIIESRVDHGRGIVSTVIIQRGTLNVGDSFIAGVFPGKVRAIFNDRGDKIDTAPPSTPVEILGFTGLSNSGDPFQVTETEKTARQIGIKRQELEKIGAAKNVKKVTLDNLYDSIHDGEIQELKVIIKGDVHGSVEALKTALEKLSTSDIKLTVIHSSAGAIVENDINLASASNAIIIGFHVRPTAKAQALAEQEKVEIKKYNIIYDAVEDIKTAMEGLLAPDLKEEAIGTVEVRDVFKVPKIGTIAGCFVQSGKVRRGSTVHLFREGLEIFTGKISSLKRFKDDAKEVEKNYECGIGLENFTDLQTGDIIEVYEIKEISKKLEG